MEKFGHIGRSFYQVMCFVYSKGSLQDLVFDC
jgi:hypothetical protein